MIKKAMILAAGFGKRILPLTRDCPKPLLKIGYETLLSNTIKFLEFSGIKQIIVNVHYLREKIINYLYICSRRIFVSFIRVNIYNVWH